MADRGTVKKSKTDNGAGSSKGNLKVKDPEVRSWTPCMDNIVDDPSPSPKSMHHQCKCRQSFPRSRLCRRSWRSRRRTTGKAWTSSAKL